MSSNQTMAKEHTPFIDNVFFRTAHHNQLDFKAHYHLRIMNDAGILHAQRVTVYMMLATAVPRGLWGMAGRHVGHLLAIHDLDELGDVPKMPGLLYIYTHLFIYYICEL